VKLEHLEKKYIVMKLLFEKYERLYEMLFKRDKPQPYAFPAMLQSDIAFAHSEQKERNKPLSIYVIKRDPYFHFVSLKRTKKRQKEPECEKIFAFGWKLFLVTRGMLSFCRPLFLRFVL